MVKEHIILYGVYYNLIYLNYWNLIVYIGLIYVDLKDINIFIYKDHF